MSKNNMVTNILIDNIKSNIEEVRQTQIKLNRDPENKDNQTTLYLSKKDLISRINRLTQRTNMANDKKAVNELIDLLSNLKLPELQPQIDALNNLQSGKKTEEKSEEEPEEKNNNKEPSENKTTTEDFDKSFKEDLDDSFKNEITLEDLDDPFKNEITLEDLDDPFKNEVTLTDEQYPFEYNKTEFYTPEQANSGEAVEVNDTTLNAKPEQKKNIIVSAFQKLVDKFKQLSNKKEKIEKEIEKRPSIDKQQLAEGTQKLERRPVFQRFKTLMARLLKIQKTKAVVEAELNRRKLKEFIEESKEIAQEAINNTKDKITDGATTVKNKVISGATTVKNTAYHVKNKVIDGTNIVKNKAIESANIVKSKANSVKDKIVSDATIMKSKVVKGATVAKNKATDTKDKIVGGASIAKDRLVSVATTVGKATFRGFKTAGTITIRIGVLSAEAVAEATKTVAKASKGKIDKMIASGNANAHSLLDKMEEAIVKKDSKTSEKINELQHYKTKSADAFEK